MLITIAVYGCSFEMDSALKAEQSSETSDKKEIEELASEIIRCFDENDVLGLSKLFSDSAHEKYNIDTQIREAFDFYSGISEKYITCDFENSGKIRNGEFIDKHFRPSIDGIKTTMDNEYRIQFEYYEVNNEYPDEIGITYLFLTDKKTDIILSYIGYDIEKIYDGELPFTRNAEYTNAVKDN